MIMTFYGGVSGAVRTNAPGLLDGDHIERTEVDR